MSNETEGAAVRRSSNIPAAGGEVASPPAGWYPSPAPGANAGAEMYWDGVQWHASMIRDQASAAPVTAEAATAAPTGAALASAPSAAPKQPWYRRKGIVIPLSVVAGLIVVSGVANAITGGPDETTAGAPSGAAADRESSTTEEEFEPEPEPVMVAVPNVVGLDSASARAALEALGLDVRIDGDASMPVVSQDVAEGTKVEAGSVVVLTLQEKPTLTLGQENAVGSAKSYLAFSGFSRAGLYQQLTSEYGEGYEAADAEFALAYLEQNGLVDWNAEAVESAKSYLEFSQFSRDGLYQQLTSEYGEGFTHEQAEYALGQVGY